MSQDYHHPGNFNFSNGFERSQQQIRRDKVRIQGGFEPAPPLIGIEEDQSTVGMLSEMFSFPSGATELLENQISQSYRNPPPAGEPSGGDWFINRQGSKNHEISDSAAAMHLFLMNPLQQQQRSPPPPSSSGQQQHFTSWVQNPNQIPGVMEGQGLSLSLSSSLHLQQLEVVAKAEEIRNNMGSGEGSEMLFFGGPPTTNSQHYNQFKNLVAAGGGGSGFGGFSFGAVRNSKYAKAAQELLEEFCSVGRGYDQFKKTKSSNPSSDPRGGAAVRVGGGNPSSSSSSKDHLPPLSSSDRLEHQRRKVKLMSMLDEVDRRYHHYGEKMQMVVNAFDMVMGFGAAVPYTCLAQKAMSRHFRCLKDAISAELKHTCELLGDKDAGTSGVTKGETPRLKILDQSLRHQRAFQQMGIIEQEAWRPQRGLPERSVNILRAWLFEHFLHPYPSDADKHLLARQTGLSRNQVSNWFINARVRLWKPMVEEMYQQESKDEADDDHRDHSSSSSGVAGTTTTDNNAQTPTPPHGIGTTTTTAITPPPPGGAKLFHDQINASENDPSFVAINARQYFTENQAKMMATNDVVSIQPPPAAGDVGIQSFSAMHEHGSGGHRGRPVNAGDVSLTLGLRHAGNLPEKRPFFS